LLTVEADPVLVETRLAGGRLACPAGACREVLRLWGWVRPRGVYGIKGRLRPRRARCGLCLVTRVLLPVTVLLRRVYAADVIGAAVEAHAGGVGHRRAGERLKVAAATVRGWLRRLAGRLEATRVVLLQVVVRAGVGVTVPPGRGCRWRDLLAALDVAAVAVTGRFGPVASSAR